MSYYENTTHVSNSMLGAFDKELKGLAPLNVTPAMVEGRLLHEAVLEPHKSFEEHGDKYLMHPKVLQYQKYKSLFKTGKCEHAICRKLKLVHPELGVEFEVRMKGQLDCWMKQHSLIYDLKFMSAKVSDPRATIEWLNYDRQAALYMDLARADKFVFIFDSHTVYAMLRNNEMYKKGRDKYIRLSYKWWLLNE